VWGVLWQLSMEDLPKLDKQEGVPKLYRRKEVEVDIEGLGLTKVFKIFTRELVLYYFIDSA